MSGERDVNNQSQGKNQSEKTAKKVSAPEERALLQEEAKNATSAASSSGKKQTNKPNRYEHYEFSAPPRNDANTLSFFVL